MPIIYLLCINGVLRIPLPKVNIIMHVNRLDLCLSEPCEGRTPLRKGKEKDYQHLDSNTASENITLTF